MKFFQKLICLVKGHQTHFVSPAGRQKARVVKYLEGKVHYQCHRCKGFVQDK